MSDDEAPAPRDAALERRRRLLRMGGVLQEVPGDETDQGWDGEPSDTAERAGEARLRRDVPPHHGD